MSTTPLTDAINALTRYANETTGASDTTLSDAVGTLVAGYGGGSIDDIIAHNYADGAEVTTNVTQLYGSTFEDTGIVSFTAPNITQLRDYRYNIFKNCTSLVSVSFPSLTTITNYVVDLFRGCTSLTSVYMPNLASITTRCAGMWQGCTSLTSISLPKLTAVGGYADDLWRDCTALTTVDMPIITELGSNEFRGCTALVNIALPACKSFYDSVFYGCTNLQAVDILGNTSGNGLRNNNFVNCSALSTIIIRNTGGVCPLNNINNFNGTPFRNGGAGGDIYVPQALLATYPTSTNWSTINGYGTITWHAIEGSYYETHYADGTVIE